MNLSLSVVGKAPGQSEGRTLLTDEVLDRPQLVFPTRFQDRQQLLLLARDRLGICPLHWTRPNGNSLAFCSEIKGLLTLFGSPPPPDIHGLDQVFQFFY